MTTVVLKILQHRGKEQIGLYYTPDATINTIVKKTSICKFSATHKCWYAPLSKENYTVIINALATFARVNNTELRNYLLARKKAHAPVTTVAKQNSSYPSYNNTISPVNAQVLPAMKEQLQLKAYSGSTIKTYLNEMAQLLIALKDIPAEQLTANHLKRYLVYCYEKLHLKENTLHSRINALKFYYEQVLRREKFFWEIPRPKKQILTPKLFNQDEITAIIKATKNIKHKTMLMLGYATGLRVSEIVRLKVQNIDSQRMCIHIEQAKGKKDRMVRLSPILLVMLREYWKTAKLKQKGYLFPGQQADEAYSARSLQLVLAQAKAKAGIVKPGSIHALRHSFATHLLDKGTDVTMIMKLLGHNSIKTTLRYLHVTNRDMLQIMSPLDDLDL